MAAIDVENSLAGEEELLGTTRRYNKYLRISTSWAYLGRYRPFIYL